MKTHWNTPSTTTATSTAPAAGTHNAELRCIELATGKVKWSEPGLGRSSLLLVDGHFVCLSEDGGCGC